MTASVQSKNEKDGYRLTQKPAALDLYSSLHLCSTREDTACFLVSLVSDSPLDCGLDPISDSPAVSRIRQSDILKSEYRSSMGNAHY